LASGTDRHPLQPELIPLETGRGPLALWGRGGPLGHSDRWIGEEVLSAYLWERYPAKVRTAIDIGGHVGWWTRLLKTRHPGARVAVIEPDVESFALLRRNTAHDASIVLYNAACGYVEGPLSVVRDPGNSGATHLVRSDDAAAHAAPGEWLVQDNVLLIPLETAIDALSDGLIDVVKCDCEGSEYDIFRNVPLAYLRRIRCIVGEHHGRVERFRAEIGARFEAAGFTLAFVAHPNPEVRDLGMFFAENRATRSAHPRALWRRLWATR
jgi:FkbM family methyltransferase